MNALIDQLAGLRLHGMAACAHDLLSARKSPSLTTAIKQLIDAETVERQVRSIEYQMRIAKFPHHKDFATFDYSAAAVTQARIDPFCSGQFTQDAHNLILVGGTGTGKTHIAIALGTTLINQGKKARFFNAVDLINALIREQAEGNAGKIIRQLTPLDCVIIDESGPLHPVPFRSVVKSDPFCSGQFTQDAHNLVGTGKTHIAIALGTTLINPLWRAAVPSDKQTLRENQRHHHHQPGVR